MKFFKNLKGHQLIVLLLLPAISLTITFYGIYNFHKISVMQSLERDHIELLWKGKYYLSKYIETNNKEYLNTFYQVQKELQSKPEAFLDMITPLDKLMLPTDMKLGIDLSHKDIDEQKAWVTLVNDYVANRITLNEFTTKEEKIFNESKENGYIFYERFKIVQKKVQYIIIGMISVVNLILMIVTTKIIVSMRKRLKFLSDSAVQIAEGTLIKLNQKSKEDEVGKVANAFNSMIDKLRSMVLNIQDASKQVTYSSSNMKESTENLSEVFEQISKSIQEVSLGAEKQSFNIETFNDKTKILNSRLVNMENSTQLVGKLAIDMEKAAENGQTEIDKVRGQMGSIKTSMEKIADRIEKLSYISDEIDDILQLINNISEQTNLLALNASIEAARAGEAGKGFNVVANEIRKLAGESVVSAEKIRVLIEQIKSETTNARLKMLDGSKEVESGEATVISTEQAFEKIKQAINEVNSGVHEVNEEIKEITSESSLITEQVDNIAKITESTSANTEEVAASIEEQTAYVQELSSMSSSLSDLVTQLNDIVIQFKLE